MEELIELIGRITYFLPHLASGLLVTMQVAVATTPLMLFIAVVVAVMRMTKNRLIYGIATIYVEIFRGTPMLIQLLYIFYVLPFLGVRIDPFESAVIGLALNMGAYISEVVRGAFQSISKGQWEAATSLCMPYALAMRRIIFPQAIRVMLPPIGNNVIELIKGSAIVSLVSVYDLTYQGSVMTTKTFETAIVWFMVAFLYFAVCYPSTFIVKWLERKTAFP